MSIAIASQTSFDGPNIWSLKPVCLFNLSMNPKREIPERLSPHQLVRLASALRALPVSPELGSLSGIAHEDATIPALTGRLAILFQQMLGIDVAFSSCRASPSRGQWDVVVEQTHPQIGSSAVRLAVGLLNHSSIDDPDEFDLENRIYRRFSGVANAHGESPLIQVLKRAADYREIPVAVNRHGITLDLGNGAFRQLLQGTATHRTSSVAVNISKSKHLTKRYLMNAGIPVSEGSTARSEDQAVQLATALGFPVVVKPDDSGAGAGVFVDLRSEEEVRAGSSVALEHSPTGTIVVERYMQGKEYRFLVINNQVEAVVERKPAQVTGDGKLTIAQLVQHENSARLHENQHRWSRKPIVLNEGALRILQREGLTVQSVPAPGLLVRLQHDDSRQLGGDFVDSLELMHPDNANLIRDAALVVGLDIAGIDIILTDISQSIWESSGGVLEVNDRPGLDIFLHPTIGQPRDPAPAIIDMLFPPGAPVRVPIVAIAKSTISSELAHLVARQLTASGHSVGLAAADGLFINQTKLRFSNPSEPWAARTIRNHPAVEIAVIEVDPSEILERGLCFDYCDVAVVTAESDGSPPGFPPPESVLCCLVDAGGLIVLDSSLSRLLAISDSFAGELLVIDAPSDEEHQRTVTVDAVIDAVVARGRALSTTSSAPQ